MRDIITTYKKITVCAKGAGRAVQDNIDKEKKNQL